MPDLSGLIPSLDASKAKGLNNLQGLNPTTDAAALKAQENDPLWKRAGQSLIDTIGGVIKGQLGIDPADKSNSEYLANAGSQILGAGLPFLSLLKGAPVFHGTQQAFEAFDPSRYDKSDILGHMTHFAEDPDYADSYAKGFMKHGAQSTGKPNIIAAHPQASNVLDLVNPNSDDISQAVASLMPSSKDELIRQFKSYRRADGISDDERRKFFAQSLLEQLNSPNNSKRIPFDAIRYDDVGHRAIAVPHSTPIQTPWGLSLNENTGKPLQVIKNDKSYGGTLEVELGNKYGGTPAGHAYFGPDLGFLDRKEASAMVQAGELSMSKYMKAFP